MESIAKAGSNCAQPRDFIDLLIPLILTFRKLVDLHLADTTYCTVICYFRLLIL
jgi:hypothetical protein